jgi:hypothetical protein
MHRQNNNPDLRPPALDEPGSFQTIHHWHLNVHQHDIGLMPFHQLHGLQTVTCLANDIDPGANGQHGLQPFAGMSTIIDDQYPNVLVHNPLIRVQGKRDWHRIVWGNLGQLPSLQGLLGLVSLQDDWQTAALLLET